MEITNIYCHFIQRKQIFKPFISMREKSFYSCFCIQHSDRPFQRPDIPVEAISTGEDSYTAT